MKPFLLLLFFAMEFLPLSADIPVQRLWEEAAPSSLGNNPDDIPTIGVFLPPVVEGKTMPPSAAILICPGGSYATLSLQTEGINEAQWFQAHGVAAFVLKYRLPRQGYRHPVPLLDAQRAMRLLRAKAEEYRIDPKKVGIMGFAAGGHLASTVETHFDLGNAQSIDPVEQQSCRPDFGILVYPVISLQGGITQVSSKVNLLGGSPSSDLIKTLSNDTQVTKDTPPTYLVHATDDQVILVQNSLLFDNALHNNGVESVLKLYAKGGNNFGYGASPDNAPRGWLDEVGAWLKSHHWMPDEAKLDLPAPEGAPASVSTTNATPMSPTTNL